MRFGGTIPAGAFFGTPFLKRASIVLLPLGTPSKRSISFPQWTFTLAHLGEGGLRLRYPSRGSHYLPLLRVWLESKDVAAADVPLPAPAPRVRARSFWQRHEISPHSPFGGKPSGLSFPGCTRGLLSRRRLFFYLDPLRVFLEKV